MVFRCAQARKYQLSRLAILADPYGIPPGSVALCYMSNVAFAHGMSHMFKFSYYVGTFEEYDMEAVRRSSPVADSPDAGSGESKRITVIAG